MPSEAYTKVGPCKFPIFGPGNCEDLQDFHLESMDSLDIQEAFSFFLWTKRNHGEEQRDVGDFKCSQRP